MNDAAPWVDRRFDVARDVMTCDPARVAGTDSLIEVAYTMRSLLVAFLPVCDQDGDLQGIIALSIPPDHRLGVTALAGGRQTPHQGSAQIGQLS